MKNKDEALNRALELAHEGVEIHSPASPEYKVCAALIVLAQTENEPVGEAYLCDSCNTPFDGAYECPSCGHNTATKEPVYATPPQRKPLEGVIDVKPIGHHSLQLIFRSQTDITNFKATHGIKEQ
ncbi:hypothetical protein UFOVP33_37 [uncultured Caudovirales phage]|uniref:Uncharacterized protein n=1 Tax=uncultured Caudovirales phage TaxID=2100421 RepID=A0A6J5KMU8_9CAUD|nr:hypothetical protein UFOVP33_37 [uncultured Caudovirales phage]